ncbi:MAG: hypothetical protein ABI338_09480 [Gemmatimonadaceae bacterium]
MSIQPSDDMTGMLRHRRGTPREFAWFGALATATYLIWFGMVHAPGFRIHPDALSWGAAFDLTITVPFAYWLLVVRRGKASLRSILWVIALSVLGAKLLLLHSHPAFLPWIRLATAPIELAIVVLAISRVRVARRVNPPDSDDDVLTQLQSTFAVLLGNAVAGRALGHEAASFYYAFGRRRTPIPSGDAATQRRFAAAPPFAGSLFLAVLGILTIEAVVLHLLVAQRSNSLAWLLTALSVYGVIWFVGFQRSCGMRVSVLTPAALVLRIGFRCDATIPWKDVASVRLLTWRDLPARAPDYLDAAKPSDPNVLIEFHSPVRVEGVYGIARTTTRVGIRLELPEMFALLVATRAS